MKYNCYLHDKDYNLIEKFWFRSQFDVFEMDKVLKKAEEIAEYNGYKYDNISVSPKN